MIELITASAGSGKTYTLAKKYIRILLEAYQNSKDTHEFEHVLAVTFTNKATAEMKDRILQELYILSQNPTLSDYYKDFYTKYDKTIVSNPNTWKKILNTLLHNYSRFSVSTIDTFFQGVLRHFAREIGSFNSYRIELDRDALVSEAADNLLSNITSSDDTVYKIVSGLITEKISEGRKFNPKRELTEIANELMGGEFIQVLEKLKKGTAHEDLLKEIKDGTDQFSERVKDLENVLSGDTSASESKTLAESILCAIDAYNSNGKNVKATVRNGIESYCVSGKGLSDACFAALQGDESKLFNKSAKNTEVFLAENKASMSRLADLYIRKNRIAELLKCIPHLKFAVSVFKAFAEVTDSANVKCLDDTTKLLSEIIAGSDAPFIYEKIGTRFDHYLLDEFQDTSHIQWDNFKPLLADANSKGGQNLVVGDVKQSIYRFRNSDYTILDNVVPTDFAGYITKTPLNTNFRSGRNIVDFNNDLFGHVAVTVDNGLSQTPGSCNILKDIYLQKEKDGSYVKPYTVGQITNKDFDGFVHYERFCGEKKEDLEEKIYPKIVSLVQELCGRGVKKKDILILVKGKEDGSHIAEDLLREGIGVCSDDSLFISSNAIARKLLAVLRYMDNRKDKISEAIVAELGEDFIGDNGTIFHSTLVDLCEKIIAKLRDAYSGTAAREEEFSGSIPYLSSLVDLAGAYETNYGNSLHSFLEYFDRKDAKIASAASEDTVRVMTIHKSKGLAGEFVIVPFINKFSMFDTHHNKKWTECDDIDLPDSCKESIYYAGLRNDVNSAFSKAYDEEYKLRCIDAMNVLYVAFTRAQHALYILEGSGKKNGNPLSELMTDHLMSKEDGHLLSNDDSGMVYELGDLAVTVADYNTPKAESNPEKKGLLDNLNLQKTITGDYVVYASKAAIRNSIKATEFFDGLRQDGEECVSDSKLKGILQHAILSLVHTVSDLDAAAEVKWQEGVLEGTKEEAKAYLEGKIQSVSQYGWFAPEATILTEWAMLVKTKKLQKIGTDIFETPVATRILPDGEKEYIVSRRPDRVVVHPDGRVDIVDYKFTGEAMSDLNKYRRQVAAYCDYYRSLPGCGDKTVTGYIWYVNADENAVVKLGFNP